MTTNRRWIQPDLLGQAVVVRVFEEEALAREHERDYGQYVTHVRPVLLAVSADVVVQLWLLAVYVRP